MGVISSVVICTVSMEGCVGAGYTDIGTMVPEVLGCSAKAGAVAGAVSIGGAGSAVVEASNLEPLA